ncbi:Hint domain-containing protein [Paracoccus aminovorans]|uniref:Hint domain-containing protein n=1 Tax=Paracoccus aminovorans TaxID=34004 RepID=UPI002B260DB0|nr:Hint domain-containing protein [Paracoccus aminovorans]
MTFDHGGHGGHCGPSGPGCENMIYLGKLPDMDPNEFLPGAEKAGKILGGTSHGSASDPLSKHLVEVSANDVNHDGVIRTNDGLFGFFSETIQHDADGDGCESTYKVDSTFIVNNTSVTFLNPDGSTETLCVPVRIMQDTGGNTFLMPPPKGASEAEIQALTTRPIVSVNFPSNSHCYDLCHDGIFTDRHCFPCFARGTLIETEHGAMPVEALEPGVKVLTRDHGLQALRWAGSRVLGSKALDVSPNLRPIRISAGALGQGLPLRDLIVSPQHRILVRSKIAQKMFGCAEVLVAAKQLLQIEGIDIAQDLDTVEYFHLLFDRHEIVLSEGAETESLYTGAEALKSVGQAAREEIFALFPELRDRAEDASPEGARLLASGRTGRKLAVRHAQHHKPLLQ